MPYYMYPRIYNSYYKDIKTKEKPNFNLRIFFLAQLLKMVIKILIGMRMINFE